jgi:hypothetical protein
MTPPVLIAHAEGEEEIALEQVGSPIRKAGYRVVLTSADTVPSDAISAAVFCVTAKASATGYLGQLLQSWNGRQHVPLYFAQLEKDVPLQRHAEGRVFLFWLNGETAAQQLILDLNREITLQTEAENPALRRRQVFISYCRRDARWLNRLQVHLKPLESLGKIDRWDDTLIDPGAKWKRKIHEAMASAKVAVLLISADFLASDFITTNELPSLLLAAETEGAVIIPVILSPCRFEQTESISQFQSINPPSQPLIKMAKGRQEEVFVKIADAIEKALRRG